MNLTVDESVDIEIATRLREDGHDVICVCEMLPGISDDEVLAFARERGDILLTCDKDFGELVFLQRRIMSGVVLIRLAGLTQTVKAGIVSGVIRQYAEELQGAFAVVSAGTVRIRRER